MPDATSQSKRRLAIVCTHPIQYNAPVLRALAQSSRIAVRVFYTWSQGCSAGAFDTGFGRAVQWDIPLLEGYDYQVVTNVAQQPGLEHFFGLSTPTLAREIEAWGAEAVLVYTWNSWSHLQALRHFKGKRPVLFRGDSTLLEPRPWWRSLVRRLVLTWVYGHVDVAIAVGSNNRRYFEFAGLKSQQIALAHHSIDTVRFGDNDEQHESMASGWRQEFGIDERAVVFVFAGKLQWQKNLPLLLEAFRRLDTGAHLVLVGNGELEGELKASAQTIANVHFMPFQNQSAMPAVYRLGDVFILPSQSETWGLALNEAMACGRAVIASSQVGGACDLIRPENGWIFESGNRSALETVLRRAVTLGRQGLRAMGKTARSDSVQWSTEESARRIAEAVLASLPANT